MRAREFTKEQQVDEIAPVVAALGGALARGATAAGSALARGAVSAGSTLAKGATSVAQKVGQGVSSAAKTIGQNVAQTAVQKLVNKVTGSDAPQKPPPPVKLPAGTDITATPAPGDANSINISLGNPPIPMGKLNLNSPEGQKVVQQLGQVAPK